MELPATFQGSVPLNYDEFLAPLFFEPYAIDFVQRIQDLKPRRVLELACGTGRLTHHLLSILDTEGTLYATDLNADMLAVAQRKIQDNRIEWQVVNAEELPYNDQRFDLVICQFGVMFFTDKLKAFKEAFRVLEPGGSFLFLTWDEVKYNAISYQSQFVLQDIFPEDPPAFFKKGPYSFFDQEEIRSTLQDAGFQDIEITSVPLTGTAVHVEDVTTGILEGSPLAVYLDERNADKGKIKEMLGSALSVYYQNGQFQFPMQALYCKGGRGI